MRHVHFYTIIFTEMRKSTWGKRKHFYTTTSALLYVCGREEKMKKKKVAERWNWSQ